MTRQKRERWECCEGSRCRTQASARSTVPLCFESAEVIRLLALWLGQSNEFIRRFSWGNSSDAFHCAREVFFPSLSSLLAWDGSSAHCAQSSVAQQQRKKGKENNAFSLAVTDNEGDAGFGETVDEISLNERQNHADSGLSLLSGFPQNNRKLWKQVGTKENLPLKTFSY